MYEFKITKIITNDNTEFIPNKINIITGPNNCGKSRFIKDIRDYLVGDFTNKSVVLKNMVFDLPNSLDDLINSYDLKNRVKKNNGNYYIRSYSGINSQSNITNASLSNYLDNQSIYIPSGWQDFINRVTNYIDINNLSMYGIPSNANNISISNSGIITYELDGQFCTKDVSSAFSSLVTDSDIKNSNNFISLFGRLFFQYLGTEEKLLMSRTQTNHGLIGDSINLLSETSSHLEDFKKLSGYTKKLFGKYIYLDRNTIGSSITIRVSDDYDFYKEFVFDDSSFESNLLKYPILDDEGDGIKSFVTTYLSIKCLHKNIFLIDEPESFLHPPLARRFGQILAEIINDNQQLFVVTHNEDILNGLIYGTPYTKFNILRITRDGDKNMFSIMDEKFRRRLRTDPLLLASNVLKGLFTDRIYVTESFADSALYQALKSKYDPSSSFYFVNVEGKDKIGPLLLFYDSLNIKSVGVYDFDYFRNSSTVTNSLQKRLGNGAEYDSLNDVFKKARIYLKSRARKLAKEEPNYTLMSDSDKRDFELAIIDNLYHNEGIESIKRSKLKEDLLNVLYKLQDCGFYVIRSGSLECVLKNIGIDSSTRKKNWIDNALNAAYSLKKEDIEQLEIYDLIADLYLTH